MEPEQYDRDDHDHPISMSRAQFNQIVYDAAAQAAERACAKAHEDGAEAGADRALMKLGLENGEAARDIAALRELLRTVKTAKSTVMTTILRLITSALLAATIGGVAFKAGVLQ